MELEKLLELEQATNRGRREMFRLGTALLFLVGIILYITMRGGEVSVSLVVAAMIGGYMALNIGANDVANNVGPAVGSKALTLTGAIFIAAIFEAAGALIAGGDVVGTIKSGIINPAGIADKEVFIWLMTAALLAGALWLNIATASGAPVSTTHSIVGGVLGAGIAAGGWGIADWGQMGQIVASWVISPALGGLISAGFLYLIKRTITYKPDMLLAARKVVPLLLALMAWAFTTYLVMKGLKQIWKVSFGSAMLIGLGFALVTYVITRPRVANAATRLENSKQGVNNLFTMPLIFSAALLSFAHGANDVANAVGPLAAINEAVMHGAVVAKAGIPLWVLLVGAIGIALGLALYGPKLIKTVGSGITELDQMRAFCIAMAASITVIVASQLGLPVSSTHIAVGAIFGVGFLREYIKANYGRMIETIEEHHLGDDREIVEAYLEKFHSADFEEKGDMLARLRASKQAVVDSHLSKKERKGLKNIYRQELVKRSALMRIVGAWLITVPVSALMAAILFFTIRGMMLP
ncbi:MAG: inorganic phosphate transporter [Pseudomonadota bacterium]|nr:inorganic phosphate transporter [Pseudomonadota bacterium]MDP1903713.1 inorganic phosphate transporter [Pseudomonadota bacterium]MDP2353438.1 inorganic phosphate transporter [Pseudomonadota bacterium]